MSFETVSRIGWQLSGAIVGPVEQLKRAMGAMLGVLWHQNVMRWSILLLPTILAALYYFAIATEQYESEARFVVRSAARPEMPGAFSFLMQLGLTRSQDDSFVVQEFMTSRDAIEKLKERLPLLAMFNREGADFLARYPSILYGREEEEFYRYFQRMVTVIHMDRTGISTLRVRTFRPEDARHLAETLLHLGEDMVNRINTRLQTDAITHSVSQLNAAQQRLITAQTNLTTFRNRELMVDPEHNAVALAELVGRLSSELGSVRAQIAELKAGTAGSPQLVGLQRKATALEQQIAEERRRIADDKDGLAVRIAAYERVQLEREFARQMVSSSEAELIRARNEAARQLLYLERVVEPHLADYSTQPKRLRLVLTVLAGNLLLLLVGWLIWSGIKEHAPHRQ